MRAWRAVEPRSRRHHAPRRLHLCEIAPLAVTLLLHSSRTPQRSRDLLDPSRPGFCSHPQTSTENYGRPPRTRRREDTGTRAQRPPSPHRAQTRLSLRSPGSPQAEDEPRGRARGAARTSLGRASTPWNKGSTRAPTCLRECCPPRPAYASASAPPPRRSSSEESRRADSDRRPSTFRPLAELHPRGPARPSKTSRRDGREPRTRPTPAERRPPAARETSPAPAPGSPAGCRRGSSAADTPARRGRSAAACTA